jgi:hypothetical protein
VKALPVDTCYCEMYVRVAQRTAIHCLAKTGAYE